MSGFNFYDLKPPATDMFSDMEKRIAEWKALPEEEKLRRLDAGEGYESSECCKIIRAVGVLRLGGDGGCLCSHFSICNFDIDVACRKSEGNGGTLVRVGSGAIDSCPGDVRAVAEEVIRQIHLHDEHTEIRVRFASYEQDHEMKCVYCSKPRPQDAYLCLQCLRDTSVLDEEPIRYRHDYSRIEAAIMKGLHVR